MIFFPSRAGCTTSSWYPYRLISSIYYCQRPKSGLYTLHALSSRIHSFTWFTWFEQYGQTWLTPFLDQDICILDYFPSIYTAGISQQDCRKFTEEINFRISSTSPGNQNLCCQNNPLSVALPHTIAALFLWQLSGEEGQAQQCDWFLMNQEILVLHSMTADIPHNIPQYSQELQTMWC